MKWIVSLVVALWVGILAADALGQCSGGSCGARSQQFAPLSSSGFYNGGIARSQSQPRVIVERVVQRDSAAQQENAELRREIQSLRQQVEQLAAARRSRTPDVVQPAAAQRATRVVATPQSTRTIAQRGITW